jgi:hypothetical protein
VVRRRKLALTYDRGRNVLGSRQRQRWVHQLDELGELPQGAQRAEAIKALGAQRQRAEAYAAAAARAAPRGGGRTAPVALGSSVPEGLEAAAAAGLSLDGIIKLPSYSMARVANESERQKSERQFLSWQNERAAGKRERGESGDGRPGARSMRGCFRCRQEHKKIDLDLPALKRHCERAAGDAAGRLWLSPPTAKQRHSRAPEALSGIAETPAVCGTSSS